LAQIIFKFDRRFRRLAQIIFKFVRRFHR
jgi:hypothetical protein